MKNVILILTIAFAYTIANAQNAKFGIKTGLNIATLTGDVGDLGNLSSKVGFNVGAFAEIKLAPKFAFQPELLYSTQGTKSEMLTDLDGTLYNVTTKINLSYLNVPILFKYYAAEKFNLIAGPQIGFLTAAKFDVTVLGQTVGVDAKDYFESVDFGLNLGAGYDFTKQVFAEFRYNVGLSNVAKTDSGDTSKVHNSVISISLGYKFK